MGRCVYWEDECDKARGGMLLFDIVCDRPTQTAFDQF